jgi:hypothetical protein
MSESEKIHAKQSPQLRNFLLAIAENPKSSIFSTHTSKDTQPVTTQF